MKLLPVEQFYKQYQQNANNYNRNTKPPPKKHTKSWRESLLQCLAYDKCVFCGTTNWILDCAHNKQDQMTRNKKDRRDCFLYSICSALVRVCCYLVHTDFNETVQRKEEKKHSGDFTVK